jgi:hypothetical protein
MRSNYYADCGASGGFNVLRGCIGGLTGRTEQCNLREWRESFENWSIPLKIQETAGLSYLAIIELPSVANRLWQPLTRLWL